MKSNLDPFHAQIVLQFFKSKEDFINFISIKKLYSELLDRFRINPIPITEETQNLFQYLDTQQKFENKGNEIDLEEIDILQINYKISYSEYLELKEKIKDKELKCKKIVYTKEDREKFGDTIPEEATILGDECFECWEKSKIIIPSNIKQIKRNCFESCEQLEEIIIPDTVTKISMTPFIFSNKLTSVKISTNLVDCPFGFFENCHNLEHIELPPYLTNIIYCCFNVCHFIEYSCHG